MTTFEARTAAQLAEKSCNWGLALVRWNDAIDAYPIMRGRTAHSALERLDIEQMAARRDGCRKALGREAQYALDLDHVN